MTQDKERTEKEMGYKWGWQISELGYEVVPDSELTMEEQFKKAYVNCYLDASVREANCGWNGIAYCVLRKGNDRREFALMFAGRNDTPNQARWIDVTYNSKGAIAEAVWALVFK